MLSLQEGLAVNGVHEQQGAADNAQNQPASATAGFQYDQASGEAHLQLCSHQIEDQLRWALLHAPIPVWKSTSHMGGVFNATFESSTQSHGQSHKAMPYDCLGAWGAAISA